ncbi:MAG: hypothetical protein LBU97_03680, partial [Alistipes sp.]|nr:hypothetical protein [Alistipes sp.]
MTYYDSGGRRGVRPGRRGRGSARRRGGYNGSGGRGGFGGFGGRGDSDGPGGGRRSFSLFDWLMMAVSAVVATGFALSWMARWISPVSYGFMSAAGLFAPVLFVANFLCLLYWVIRWRAGVYIPLAMFVWGLCGITLYFKPALTRDHADH